MTSTPQFAHCDTKKPDGFYVQFERKLCDDPHQESPDKHSCGFWPSQDRNSAGYVGECSKKEFAGHMRKAKERMAAWERGDWSFVGVRAKALCFIVQNGVGTYVNLESPGVWGVESDAGDYLNELYQEQIDELKGMIEAMRSPIYEESKS